MHKAFSNMVSADAITHGCLQQGWHILYTLAIWADLMTAQMIELMIGLSHEL